MNTRNHAVASLISGILFGAGLALSQMINPVKILDFLDFFGNWDPSLGLVMVASLAVTAVGFRRVLRAPGPLFDIKFHLPSTTQIDRELLLGATIFGIGWGVAGYCPGPGVAALVLITWEPVWFTLAVIAGFFLHRALSQA